MTANIATTEFIPKTTLSGGGTTTVTSRVIELNRREASNVSVHTLFNEDAPNSLEADVFMEVSIDPRANPNASAADQAAAKWIDVTALGLTVAAIVAGVGSVMDIFSTMTVAYFRQRIVHTAGTGDARSYIAGHR